MKICTHRLRRCFSPSLFVLCVALNTWSSSSIKRPSPDAEAPAMKEEKLTAHQREFLSWGRSQIAQIFQTRERGDQKIREFKQELAAKGKKDKKVKQQLLDELRRALAADSEQETALWQEQKSQRRAMLATTFVAATLAAIAVGIYRYRQAKTRQVDAGAAHKPAAVPTESLIDLSYGENYDFMLPAENSVAVESKKDEREEQVVRANAPRH